MSVDQFPICLGLCLSPDVIRVEFGLGEKYTVEINETVGKMQLNEVIALMLVFGQQRFVAGPMMILADLVTECNLEWLFSYLVIAQGDIAGLTALAELLEKRTHRSKKKVHRTSGSKETILISLDILQSGFRLRIVSWY